MKETPSSTNLLMNSLRVRSDDLQVHIVGIPNQEKAIHKANWIHHVDAHKAQRVSYSQKSLRIFHFFFLKTNGINLGRGHQEPGMPYHLVVPYHDNSK